MSYTDWTWADEERYGGPLDAGLVDMGPSPADLVDDEPRPATSKATHLERVKVVEEAEDVVVVRVDGFTVAHHDTVETALAAAEEAVEEYEYQCWMDEESHAAELAAEAAAERYWEERHADAIRGETQAAAAMGHPGAIADCEALGW